MLKEVLVGLIIVYLVLSIIGMSSTEHLLPLPSTANMVYGVIPMPVRIGGRS